MKGFCLKTIMFALEKNQNRAHERIDKTHLVLLHLEKAATCCIPHTLGPPPVPDHTFALISYFLGLNTQQHSNQQEPTENRMKIRHGIPLAKGMAISFEEWAA